MTKLVFNVWNRPKKDETGLTSVGWLAECGREDVPCGGYLTTYRTPPGKPKKYGAVMVKKMSPTFLDTDFTTRAQAGFAIWRSYYEDLRIERRIDTEHAEAIIRAKREERARRRNIRMTPEGKLAYRDELNSKARAKRAMMTPEEKAVAAHHRRNKRDHDNMVESYSN